jgi:hypothetical protein
VAEWGDSEQDSITERVTGFGGSLGGRWGIEHGCINSPDAASGKRSKLRQHAGFWRVTKPANIELWLWCAWLVNISDEAAYHRVLGAHVIFETTPVVGRVPASIASKLKAVLRGIADQELPLRPDDLELTRLPFLQPI